MFKKKSKLHKIYIASAFILLLLVGIYQLKQIAQMNSNNLTLPSSKSPDADTALTVCDSNFKRYQSPEKALAAGLDYSEFGATFCPEYKMHPSWDSDKDGINDCYLNNSCNIETDYSQPR